MNLFASLLLLAVQAPGTLEVAESGDAPARKITVTSAGVYRAVLWQASGGGIMEFYDLAADPEAKINLAGWDRGLFEVGWHGRNYKGDKSGPDCCRKHILYGKTDDVCYDGCRDWPSIGHKDLKAEGKLEVIEKNAARARVRVESVFTWWAKYADPDMPITAVYTFYPSGRIAVQVRVRKAGNDPFRWSAEYGPHLFVAAPKEKPELNPLFTFSTPTVSNIPDGFKGSAEALVLAASPKVRTTFLLTIPTEFQTLFSRHWRHDGRSVRWDRAGYGSETLVMQPGYDSTWACMIQMGTAENAFAPSMATPPEAMPHAIQYRVPPVVRGAELVKDDDGDFNRDGFNESEGCTVLRGAGPLRLTIDRGDGAGFAPAFKVRGWKGEAVRSVEIDGKEVPAASAVAGETLILQVHGRIAGAQATMKIGK